MRRLIDGTRQTGRLVLLLALAGGLTSVEANTPLAFLASDEGTQEVRWLYWQQIRDSQPLEFSISSHGTPDIASAPSDPAIDEFEAIQLAFETWERVSGVGVEFSLRLTETNEYGFDGENVIFFDDLGPAGYGAVTLITFDNTSGRLLDVDIHMNDHTTEWRTSSNAGDGEPLPCPCEGVDPDADFLNDVQGLATHEIGHALGLDHSAVGLRESATTPTMYPRGIYFVPGEGTRPPNSRYRTLELDDIVGLQNLYAPEGSLPSTGKIAGVAHDRHDQPLFGAHIVARDLLTGAEVGAMSGLLEGTFEEAGYELRHLPVGQYELREEPLTGLPPGLVGPQHFGGIPGSVIPLKFPQRVDLATTYYPFARHAPGAVPVALASGQLAHVPFRPIAAMRKMPRFLSAPEEIGLEGRLNLELTGPLERAELVYSIDQRQEANVKLPLTDATFSVPIERQPTGAMIQYRVEVRTLEGAAYRTPTSRLQTGLSLEPLILVSKTGAGRLSAVDSRTLFEIDETPTAFSFPLGQAFHKNRFGIYVASFGSHKVTFVPFSAGTLPSTRPSESDRDGDGLLDVLEDHHGTDPDNPDSDGDLALDGDEISELFFVHPEAGTSSFEIIGATLALDGETPLGPPWLSLAVWGVDDEQWHSPSLTPAPSGRFRLRLPAGASYRIQYYDYATSEWVHTTPDLTGVAGGLVTLGTQQLPLPAPDPAPRESGTDPLDPYDGPIGLFLKTEPDILLEEGSEPSGLALSPGEQEFLYVTGSGSNKVYKIDTKHDELVDQAFVGNTPKGIAVSSDGTKLYVANVNSASVSVLQTDTLDYLETIPIRGRPQYVSLTSDGSRVVVTSTAGSDGADIAFIDTRTDTIVEELASGLPAGSVFLSGGRSGRTLVGSFVAGASELALIDEEQQSAEVIELGGSINTTSGVAIGPLGYRGWVVHYLDPELVELSLVTGRIGRRLPLDFVDIRDISLVDLGPRKPRRQRPGRRADLDRGR